MKHAPLPIVSGRYFFPNAPLLCLKRIPACEVISLNSIGPEGRKRAVMSGVVGASFAAGGSTCFWGALSLLDGAVGGCVLHPITAVISRKQFRTQIRCLIDINLTSSITSSAGLFCATDI